MDLSLDTPLSTAGYWLRPPSDLTPAHPAQSPFPVKPPKRRKQLEKLGFTFWHCHLPAINHLTSLICVLLCTMGISPISEGFCKDERHKAPSSVPMLRNTVLLAPDPAWATLRGWSPMTLDRHHGFLSTHSPTPASPRPAPPGSGSRASFLANHRHCLPLSPGASSSSQGGVVGSTDLRSQHQLCPG